MNLEHIFGDFLNKSMVVSIFLVILVPTTLIAQRGSDRDTSNQLRNTRLEVPGGKYVPTSRENLRTSPGYRFSSGGFTAVQVNVSDSGHNIVGDAANEPSIAIDPNNPNRMAIGWRQFNTVSSSFRQAGYAYTTDAGQTWMFPGVIQPGVFRSDPVLDSDSQGKFYYNSLTSSGSDFWCHVFKSSDGGVTWDTGTYARGGDKQWMVIDKTGGIGEGNVYAYWTSYWSICPPGFFTRSTNHGVSYEDCVVIPGNPFWGTLAVGTDGELYVFGASGDSSGFTIAKSSTARDSSTTVTWDMSRAVNLDGEIVAFAGFNSPNPSGLLGQAWVAVDHSNGSTRGNVYTLCSVERNSLSDPLDVMFVRSTDGGVTWSSPVRVNDDTSTSAWQWFGTMSVAPNGRIDVVWLDTRDNPGTVNSSLYYSFSTDAGVTWTPNERLSGSFNPHVGWPQQQKMGDYFDIVSDDVGVHLAWAATFNNEQDVYYGHISAITGVTEREEMLPASYSLSQNYPNPFNPSTVIRFQLPVADFVTLKVYNLLGQEVAALVEKKLEEGNHTVGWNASRFPSGIYICRFHTSTFVEAKKLILLK